MIKNTRERAARLQTIIGYRNIFSVKIEGDLVLVINNGNKMQKILII